MSYAQIVIQGLRSDQFMTVDEVCLRCPSVPRPAVRLVLRKLVESGLAEVNEKMPEGDGFKKKPKRVFKSRQRPLLLEPR